MRLHSGLSDETRVRIVNLLLERPCSVSQISRALGISQPRTSQHLRILRELGVVSVEKQGNIRIYQLHCDAFYTELLQCITRLRDTCRILRQDLENLRKQDKKESVST